TTRKRDLATARLSESVGVFADESSCGHRTLVADGYTVFAAWDSADGRNWTIEIAVVEGEVEPMPAGSRRLLKIEAESGHRGSWERALAKASAAIWGACSLRITPFASRRRDPLAPGSRKPGS